MNGKGTGIVYSVSRAKNNVNTEVPRVLINSKRVCIVLVFR